MHTFELDAIAEVHAFAILQQLSKCAPFVSLRAD